MARQKIEYGLSANDKRGDPLRDGAILIEDTFKEIYMFLSGGLSEVELPNALPKERGGTGSNTTAGTTKFLLDNLQDVYSLSPIFGLKPVMLVEISDTTQKSTTIGNTSHNMSILKLNDGNYKIPNVGTKPDFVLHPSSLIATTDINGNRNFALNMRMEDGALFLDVYNVKIQEGVSYPDYDRGIRALQPFESMKFIIYQNPL